MLHRVNLDLGAYQTLHTGHVTSCSIDSESTLPRHRSIPERNVCRSGIHSWKAWHQSIWPTCVRATEEVVVVCSTLLLWDSGPATLRRLHPSVLMLAGRCGCLSRSTAPRSRVCVNGCVSVLLQTAGIFLPFDLVAQDDSRIMVYYWTFEWSETADDLAPWFEESSSP